MKPLTTLRSFILLALVCTTVKAQQWDGLTLYSNQNSAVGYLIDTASNIIKTFNFTGNTGYSMHMMPGGNIFRTVNNPGNILTGGGMTGRIQKIDYNGNVLWDYTYSSSTYCLHHDHCPLPNGNVLVISYDVKTAAEVAAAGGTLNGTVWSEKIMELQPVGTNSAIVVWEWKVWDHLVQNTDNTKPGYYASIVDHPELLNINYTLKKDWIHMNGIDYNPLLDQISLSSHNLNEWYIIDHSTSTAEAATHSGGKAGKGGDLLYRWGNPAAYNASGTRILNVTHDAHWIKEDCANGGNLAGINNRGSVTTTTKTTADQVILPRVGMNYTITPGSAFLPSSYSSRKVGVGYTTNMGSVEEYPNGNQMFCLATIGTIYEIDAAGNTLWTKTTNGTTPQAHRYTQCYINSVAPVQPTITVSSNTLLTSSFANTFQWYLNGTAIPTATNQTYAASQSGHYTVRTGVTNGCVYAYAALTTVTIGTIPVDDTGIGNWESIAQVKLYPNPTEGSFTIEMDAQAGDYLVSVMDLNGKMVYSGYNQTQVNLENLGNGLYIVRISNQQGQSLNRKLTLNK